MNWLDTPIPRKQALAAVLLANVGSMMMYASRQIALKHAAQVHADQEQRIVILTEATDFLLDKADDATAIELNEKLDYWRVIRGIDARS